MKFLRAGIYALIAFAVAAHGGVEDWAKAVLETGAGLLLLVWAARTLLLRGTTLQLPVALPPLILFAVLVFAQWKFHLTVYGYATRVDLQLLLAYLIVIFLAAQAFETTQDWKGFIWFVMSLGFAVSIFGILQHLTFNGKLYWFREMRYGGIPFGPYVNRNHFAGLVELVIPAGLVPLALGRVRRERWPIAGLFTLIPIGALFLSASRGGIVSFLWELALLAMLLLLRRSGAKHAVAGGVILLLALALVSWLGVRQALERFASLQPLEVTHAKRISMARDTRRIFLDYPVAGTGLGTLQSVYPKYETLYDGKIVNHAHNDYLEALAETGLLGGACCAWFLVLLISRGLKRALNPENTFAGALHTAGLIGCLGFLAHSVVDFNLHIPSNVLLFFLLSLLATVEMQRTTAHVPSRNS
ncbi:MAG: hypothetical protein AUG07_00170 [Acidobacteria bacterium 13_1_20CM_2_60_10]|nr:MAG: hypothetical protein AUG07_00170 [Acidobacteria bacterium 13_1_20CM_2_60_10]